MAMQFFYVVPIEGGRWSVSHNDDTLQFKSKEEALQYARAKAKQWKPSAVIELSKSGELLSREDLK